MSEPKLISPMLDNFGMGAPISDHNGVRCCPAMEQNTEDKYIVKVISIPASQTQLDALLLSGAYENADAAREYFRSLSQDVVEEAAILQKLAKIEGFVPYDRWQIVEMEDGTGFDVYLLGSYKRSLERHLRRNTMTHLGAVNLGLDLCTALAACRRSGYLYVDLKPENVFITEEQEYRIGDLGFIRLGSLQYASLPDKYRSCYTPPEITDAFSALNTTLDTYALGLMLYQAYNDGKLPFTGDTAPVAEFPAPEYADEEMAQIILKACVPNPEDRWQDPVQMGQALVTYMQRNGANDVPIVPTEDADAEVKDTVDEKDSSSAGVFIAENSEEPVDTATEAETAAEELEETEEDQVAEEVVEETNAESTESANTETEQAEIPEVSVEAVTEESVETEVAEEIPSEAEDEEESEEEEFENLSFLDYLSEETDVSGFAETELAYDTLSQDVSDMLSQADTLATLTVPEPVVAPEPIEVPMPEPIVLEKEPPEELAAEEAPAETEQEAAEEAQEEVPAEESEETPYLPAPGKKRRKGGWIALLIALVLLLGISLGGYYYYQNIYLQTIDSILLEGDEGTLSVFLTTDADERLLTVYCSDSYGNRFAKPVENGWAVFTDLDPSTFYHIEVAIEGFHELRGETGKTYSTPAQTEIVQLHAVTGGTDGSVIVSFTVNGPDSQQWKALYWTDGGATQEVTFSNHVVTITGLTPGKDYTFRIEPVDDLFVTGKTEITYQATSLIYAEGLKISACPGNELTAVWNAPAGVQVGAWSVRCYNANGYNQTLTVTGTTATFTGIDHSQSYTVEVTAEGMSVSQQVHFSANTLTANNFKADFSDPTKLTITWDSCVKVSAEGWVLLYTIDGGAPMTVTATENVAVISPVVPGATYEITLQAANKATVLGGSFTCTAPSAKVFSCTYQGFAITGSNMIFHMCKTPAKADWDRGDLAASDYTTTFTAGQKASFLVQMTRQYGTSSDLIQTLFVIRDSQGKLVSTGTSSRTWTQMWYQNYCELDIPAIPATAGNYTIAVYFNGGLAAQVDFSVI